MTEPAPTIAPSTIAWFPVFTLLLGWALSSATDFLQHRRSIKRERETRDALVRTQLAERRASFQRQTLLDLQEAVFDLMRATGAMHHQDEMAYRKTGQWEKQLHGEELNQKAQLAMRRVSMLSTRVRDISLRELIEKFRTHCVEATVSGTRESSRDGLDNAVASFDLVQKRVGELLRTLDDEESNLARSTPPS